MRKGEYYLEHDEKGLEGIEVEEAAAKIYSRYFEYVITTLEPMIDSLEKLNTLINNEKNLQGERVVPSVYNSPIQDQILTGVAMAILVKPVAYDAILSEYRKYLTDKFKPGADECVDLAQVLIAKYGSS